MSAWRDRADPGELAAQLRDYAGKSRNSHPSLLLDAADCIDDLADARSVPYPPTDRGRTHYEGCWRDRGHHECAVAEIERLRSEVAAYRAAGRQLAADVRRIAGA